MKRRFIFSVIIFALVCCNKNEIEQYGQYVGTVNSEFGQALEGATITINSSSNYTTKTNSNGQFSFNNIPVNIYQYEISMKGYVSLSGTISILNNKTVTNVYTLETDTASRIFSISDSLLFVSILGGKKSISINSNSSWIIRNQNNWITCSLEGGNGNKMLDISWQENTGSFKRSGLIEFSSGGITRKLLIIQDFPLKLIKYTGSDGIPKLSDSLFLLFNKPIKVNSISSASNLYSLGSQISYIENSHGFKFQCKYAEMGGSYPFAYTVTDSAGDKYSNIVTISLYTKRIDFQGIITDFFISSDDQYCWVSVRNPNKLVLLSLKDFKILKEFTLTFPPYKIHLNVFNDNIYILPGDAYHYIYDSHIYVFDKQSGEIIKTISLKAHANDHPQYPAIFPGNICFTKTGYGIVTLGTNGSSGGNLDVIDSSLGDSIYQPKDWSIIGRLYPNYSYNKIIISDPYGSCTISQIDGNSHEMNTITPPINELLGGIYPNKRSNKVLFSGHDRQFILNLDNNQIVGNISYVARGGIVDFSYKTNEDNYVYLFDGWNGYFKFLDYNNGKTICDFKAIYSLTNPCYSGILKISSTINGNYLIAVGCQYLYIFNTDIFSEN